jgi:hypothetical protein
MQYNFLFPFRKNKAVFLLFILSILLSACSDLQAAAPIKHVFDTLGARAMASSGTETPMAEPSANPPALPLSLPDDSPTPRVNPDVTTAAASSPTPTPTLTPSPAPSTSSDLLYLSQDRLMRWDHVTQFATLLVDRVTDYTALVDPFSAYQQPPNYAEMTVKNYPRLVALLRSREIAANGSELFDLDILDLESKRTINLYEKISRIEGLQFTLQGDRLVYIDRNLDEQIYVTQTSPDSEPRLIATCIQEGDISCQNAWWSPDGRALVWSDAEGIWLSDDRSANLRQLQTNRITVRDPKGQAIEIKVSYDLISWSPDSRFLLVKIVPSANGVQWYSILDTRKAQLVDIPNTAEFSTPISKITWSYDGNLLLGHSSNPEEKQAPFIQVWKIVPTSNDLLVAGQRLNLAQNASAGLQTGFSQQEICPIWFQQLDATTFRLGLIDPKSHNQTSLTQLDIEKNILESRLTIPVGTDKILWAPDASGALLLGKDGQILYASFLNQEWFDFGVTLGSEAHNFQWLATAPR